MFRSGDIPVDYDNIVSFQSMPVFFSSLPTFDELGSRSPSIELAQVT